MKLKLITYILFILLFSSVSCAPAREGIKLTNITNNKEIQFEPSGLARITISGDDRFLIINDQELDNGLYIYKYDAKHHLLNPNIGNHNPILIFPGEGPRISKWEGITSNGAIIYLLSSNGEIFKTDFSNQDRFFLSYCADISEAVMGIASYIRTEGIALTPDRENLLIGFRCRKKKSNFTFEIYRIDLSTKQPKTELVLSLGKLMENEGISSIEYDEFHNVILVLTSIELEGNTKEDVSGYLWAVSADLSNIYSRIFKFDHKPEGVAVSKEGDIIVVIDDDGRRKDPFGLKQNESCYIAIPEKMFSEKIWGKRL